MRTLAAWEVTYQCGNKNSYIDSFLDRAYNATEMAIGINAALHGDDKYRWFID